MASTETFDRDLLARITAVLHPGDVVSTLEQGRPNRIGRIDEHGIEVTTGHSASTVGGARLVPAWMFNHVWNDLNTRRRVERDYVDRLAPGRKIKRSSAVFAILERLPDVSVVQRRPLVLGLNDDSKPALLRHRRGRP